MSLPAKISGKRPDPKADIPVFDERCLRETVTLDHAALDIISGAFVSVSKGLADLPPALHLVAKEYHGEIKADAAYVSGIPYFALRVRCGFHDNALKGLPAADGLMNLFHADTGQLAAIFLDNQYLKEVGVALTSALAARYLTKNKLKTVGVIGTGAQVRMQLQALALVRDYEEVLVWSSDFNETEQFIDEMSRLLNVSVKQAEEAETLVKSSDIVILTEVAREVEPVIKADWLHPGIHVTALGGGWPEKNALDPNIIVRADRYVCDQKKQCIKFGALHHAIENGAVPPEQFPVTELGELVRGQKKGRENDDQVTVCDLTATGVPDTMMAIYAYERLCGQR